MVAMVRKAQGITLLFEFLAGKGKMLFSGPEQFLKIPSVKSSLSFLFLEYALNLNGTCSHLVILRQFFKTQCVFEHLHHEFEIFIIV